MWAIISLNPARKIPLTICNFDYEGITFRPNSIFTTKKEAIKRASYIRTHGCFFTDDMKKDELTGVIVMVTTEQDNSAIYEQPLTKKYLSFRKK